MSRRSATSRHAPSETGADVLHGHGAKGGAYARLARAKGTARLHALTAAAFTTGWGSPVGLFYLAAEKVLRSRTDLFLFESAYGRDVFAEKIGLPAAPARVVHNGVNESEFLPVKPLPDATDLLFVGELRMLKGVDVLIKALAQLAARGARRQRHDRRRRPRPGAFEAAVAAAKLDSDGALCRRKTRAHGLCTRAHAGGAVARGIPALYRAGSRRSRHPDRSPAMSEGSLRFSGRTQATSCRRATRPRSRMPSPRHSRTAAAGTRHRCG